MIIQTLRPAQACRQEYAYVHQIIKCIKFLFKPEAGYSYLIMSLIATALVPILALILLGFFLKQIRFLPEEAWAGMEKLTYFVLFPSLLVGTLGEQKLTGMPWPVMLQIIFLTLGSAATALILWHRFRASVSNPTFTSVFQGGVRFNTYIALAMAQALFGEDGLAMGAVAAGFMIVLINLLCVSAFSLWSDTPSRGAKPFFLDIVANPLILACALGWFLSISGIGLPGVTGPVLEIAGRAALPFGLLAVGAALRPGALHGHIGPMLFSSVVQFVLKPAVTALAVSINGLSGIPAGVLIIFFAVPTAPSAYILARQLGGDTETMASIITFQTMLAFLVIPIIVLLIRVE